MTAAQDDARPVVALGTFDGVHAGHREMLRLAREAAGRDGTVVAATFDPHPRAVVRGGAPPLLCEVDERLRLLDASGADRVQVIPFTEALSGLSPEQFVDEWLVERLDARAVVVGSNFRFGHRAAGDVATLTRLGVERGFTVTECDLLESEGAPVSSSRIRGLLATGDVDEAGELLGRPYRLHGRVVHGARRGRELGMPTANIEPPAALLVPADGVYAGIATLDGTEYIAATSVGTNPQFTADQQAPPRTVEAHLLDYDGPDFYGADLAITFVHRVRRQAVFPDVDALVARMQQDLVEVRAAVAT